MLNLEYLHQVKEIQCVGKVEVYWQVYLRLGICGLLDRSIINKRNRLFKGRLFESIDWKSF